MPLLNASLTDCAFEMHRPTSVAAGTPSRVIEQSGWRIGYDAFRPTDGLSLPARFSAVQGDVRLKVVIDDWTLPVGSGPGP